MIADGIGLLAAATLGLSAGALFAEGAVLVPYWRSLAPDAFLAWYRRHGGLLIRFFGPLEVAAAVLALAAALAAFASGAAGTAWTVAAVVLAVAVILAFPFYFQKTNASFAEGTIPTERVPQELARWSAWHWGRSVVAAAAFAASLRALQL